MSSWEVGTNAEIICSKLCLALFHHKKDTEENHHKHVED